MKRLPVEFKPRGKTVFHAIFYGLVDGTKFGLKWAWRYLFGDDQ